MPRNKGITAIALVIALAFLSGCPGRPQQGQRVQPDQRNQQDQRDGTGTAVSAGKANTVARDLGNVTISDMFRLSDSAISLLGKNGFVVVPNNFWKEFFWLYEENRYGPAPSFITTDSMLHNYHLFFAHLLRVIEAERLVPELKSLNRGMLSIAQRQYAALKGTSWEDAARRNVGFFAVGSALLDPGAAVPAAVKDVVDKELALIERHEGIALSPLMNMGGAPDVVEGLKEDYSQYIPRGHKAYFKAMMWCGRMTFRLKNEDETKSAALITLALSEGDTLAAWKRIYEPTSFLVGKSDDISPIQFREVMDEMLGPRVDVKALVSDRAGWTAFLDAAARLEPPAINSIPIFDETIQPDREREIKGFRFMGQRFTVDASIFQRLVYREVKENAGGQRRMLPKGLDIPAVLGSAEAYQILESMGETGYRGYPESVAGLRAYIAGLDEKTWTQNLYWGWLYSILPLVLEKPEGYPCFMRNSAWARKDLNTFLGSWVELKHDTILYSKAITPIPVCGGQVSGAGMAGVSPGCHRGKPNPARTRAGAPDARESPGPPYRGYR